MVFRPRSTRPRPDGPHASATQPAARPPAAPTYSPPATPTPGNAAPSPKDGDHPTDPANTTDPTSTQLPDRESRLGDGGLLFVDPARVRLPRGLLGGTQRRADLRPGGARRAGGPDGELATVAGLAGDDLAEREQFEGLVAGQREDRRVRRQILVHACRERVPVAQFVVAGDGGTQGVPALDLVWRGHAESIPSSWPDVKFS